MHSNTFSQKNEISRPYSEALSQARALYDGLGFVTIPIKLGEKAPPLIKGWQTKITVDIWLGITEPVNVAIRCGGKHNLAVIDCDEAKTLGVFEQIVDYLYLQGINTDTMPIVQTASGIGRHIYLRTVVPTNGNYFLLNPEFGAGEFRYGLGAYVLAPPSVVEGKYYKLISGDFSKIPECNFASLEPILKISTQKSEFIPNLTISPKRKSKNAWRILSGDKTIIGTFLSRSEADCSLMISLIKTNHTREEIFELFNRFPCSGKYPEILKKNKNAAYQYFNRTYEAAYLFAASNSSEGREIALRARKWALHTPWPGRSGIYDRAVFLALTEIASYCGKVEYGASGRQIAALVPTITDATADRAINRLIKQGLLTRTRKHTSKLAPTYIFNKTYALNHNVLDDECITFQNHEVFSYRALGLSSKQILDSLIFRPKTVDELVIDTGRSGETIKKWLYRMSRIVDPRTGEIHCLVVNIEGYWAICEDYDLDHLAAILGVSGKMNKRIREFEEQRYQHNKVLNLDRRLCEGNKNINERR